MKQNKIMKAIYSNGKLREVIEIPNEQKYLDRTFKEGAWASESHRQMYFDALREYQNPKTYPITGNHSFEEGKEYVEGKDYELETFCNLEDSGKPCQSIICNISCAYKVALPLPQQESEDELWLEIFNDLDKWSRAWKGSGDTKPKIQELISQFSITRKPVKP